MVTLLLFIVILSLLVFVHEYGHFATARRLGIGVEEFGFGFPPRVAGIRRGGVIYSINAIPFGGFVRLKGESGESSDSDSFSRAGLGKRCLVIVAGVGMNFLLTILLFTVVFTAGLLAPVDETLPGAQVKDISVYVTGIASPSPAEQAGLEPGDTIRSVNGQILSIDRELRQTIEASSGQPLTLETLRNHEPRTVTITAVPLDGGTVPKIGVGLATVGVVRYPIQWAVVNAVRSTVELAGKVVVAFGGLVRDLVIHQRVSPDVAGPVGIAVMTGAVAKLGLASILQFMALLSLSLAVINVLPLPALDGGRLAFLFLERLRGHAVRAQTEAWVHNIGFVLLIGLVAVISWHDLQRYGLLTRLGTMVRALWP